jgi:hypothetical protein
MKKEKSIIDFFTGAGTGIIVSCLLSPDSIRRTAAIRQLQVEQNRCAMAC